MVEARAIGRSEGANARRRFLEHSKSELWRFAGPRDSRALRIEAPTTHRAIARPVARQRVECAAFA